MKRLFLTISLIIMIEAIAATSFAVPYDGSSVSILGAQFSYNATTHQFTTASGSDSVIVQFSDPGGNPVYTSLSAALIISPVDFSSGFTSGTGGGFAIREGMNTLLSGTFGLSSITSQVTGAEFESSLIVTFIDPNLVGTNYYAPGQFSATLGDIGSLNYGSPWTTGGNATAEIQSSVAVPEPASLILLGSGLAGLGFWSRKYFKGLQ